MGNCLNGTIGEGQDREQEHTIPLPSLRKVNPSRPMKGLDKKNKNKQMYLGKYYFF